MDFEGLLFLKLVDAQVDVPAQEMDPDPVIAAAWQDGEFHQGVVIDPQIILAGEADLCSAVPGFELIALDDGQVGNSRFRPEIAGPIDDDIAFDIGHPNKTPAVIILLLGESEE